MRTESGGYLLVVSDRRAAWAGVRVCMSRFRGDVWIARARRLMRHGRRIPPALKLVSAHYVDDPARARAQLAEALGPRFAGTGRARKARLRKALTPVLADDKSRLEDRFDPLTGLFRTPGDALPGPAKRLVARLAAEVVSRTPRKRRTLTGHLRRPYALGLLWPMLADRLEAESLPALYRPEIYRALVRALAGSHFTDADMAEILSRVAAEPAEYRVAAWEYGRFARQGQAGATPGLDRFAFYLLAPRDHMIRGLADYRRRVHGSAPVRLAIWSFRVLQITALAAAAAAVGWLVLAIEGGLMPGLTLFFAVGAAILAGRLYLRPDMARLMGHVGERDLESARAALDGLHPHTLETIAPVPPRVSATTGPDAHRPAAVMPVPHGAERGVPQPADIPAPVPVPGAGSAPLSRPAPAAAHAGITNAYITTPLGPIPFPVPRGPVPDRSPAARAAEAGRNSASFSDAGSDAGAEPAGEEGSFILGWGMPIPVPNWMAATAPDVPDVPAAGVPVPPVPEPQQLPVPEGGTKDARVFHAPPLPPVLPSPAFWGIDGAGLQPGDAPRPGAGDGSRRRNS